MTEYTCRKCGGATEVLNPSAMRGRRLFDMMRPRVQCVDCKHIFKLER